MYGVEEQAKRTARVMRKAGTPEKEIKKVVAKQIKDGNNWIAKNVGLD